MTFCGLQTLSLVDFPGKVAATVFTGGCNLRCPYCHNARLVTAPAETRERYEDREILEFLSSRRGLLDGVVLSGGEPLLHEGLSDFAARVKTMGFAVKLDTNGCYPQRLRALLETGCIDYVAMDIKNSLPKYPLTVGVTGFDAAPVEESAALLMGGPTDYEFRTTLVRELHTRADLLYIARWVEGARRYFLQSFTDSGELIGSGLHGFSPDEMHSFAEIVRPYFGEVSLRSVD
ncbi:anaerobic ribonucleoside-triphosphate reductase activating protein [Oscillibacter sp.]|uniref:anaerobic ribonucleoside-triphosphate reductase activating protein n=1 Tax=Oscillibacter sp. TaxID=1945593 RepID=UPI00289EEE7C|nr:anaerobic ribonucleoside-triphosphate reductase activating protein [Oscillibacter sp.]